LQDHEHNYIRSLLERKKDNTLCVWNLSSSDLMISFDFGWGLETTRPLGALKAGHMWGDGVGFLVAASCPRTGDWLADDAGLHFTPAWYRGRSDISGNGCFIFELRHSESSEADARRALFTEPNDRDHPVVYVVTDSNTCRNAPIHVHATTLYSDVEKFDNPLRLPALLCGDAPPKSIGRP
jgi:hypothetical protein